MKNISKPRLSAFKMAAIVAVIAIGIGVLTGCDINSTQLPAWLRGFKTAVFVPELEDVVPSVALSDSSAQRALMNRRSAARTNGQPVTIPVSEVLKGDNVEWLYQLHSTIQYHVDIYKDYVSECIDISGIEAPNVWGTGQSRFGNFRVKYEETSEGDKIYYAETEKFTARFSMYADGVNESYVSDHDPDFPFEFYSYYLGSRFIYLLLESDTLERRLHEYIEFDEIDGLKKGIAAWGVIGGDRQTYYAYSFEGNDENMELYNISGEDSDIVSFEGGSVSTVKPGYSFTYYDNSIKIDVHALNIKEVEIIEFDSSGSGEAHKITLDDGSIIPGSLTDYSKVQWGDPIYLLNLLPLEWEGGKYHQQFEFYGASIMEFTNLNDVLAHWAPGLVSAEDFDIEYHRLLADDLLDNFPTQFDTFSHIPFNIGGSLELRDAIAEYIEANAISEQ